MIPIQYGFIALWFLAMMAFVYRLAIVRERALMMKRGREIARVKRMSSSFVRPSEMGPITVPWQEIVRMRLAVYADQIQSDSADTPLCHVGAWALNLLPYAGLEGPRERALFWLMHTAWEESPTWALS